MTVDLVRRKNPNWRPKILLTGRTGQVGGDLHPLLRQVGEVLATNRSTLDLTRPEKIRECVRSFRPDVIINAAAYTAVDKAESEPAAAHLINAVVPGVLAEEAEKCGALLVHFSTDYVFDGVKSEPYLESDPINPLNVYGRTKAAGEEAITRISGSYIILRTSWVYSQRGSNFLLTIRRLAKEREELGVVDDQIGAPTASRDIAEGTVQVLQQCLTSAPAGNFPHSGIYHITASGQCSWYDFADEILRTIPKSENRLKKLRAIRTSEYPTPAQRPKNSRLNCSKILERFGVQMLPWQVALREILDGCSLAAEVSQGN